MTRPPWFGRLLDWTHNPQTGMRTAKHTGRSHYMLKLARRDADAHRTRPGWHLLVNDERGSGPDGAIGPHVGDNLATACVNAETWIVAAESDLRQYPRLSIAMYSGGVAYEGFNIRRDDIHERFTVHRDNGTTDRGPAVGTLRPLFLGCGDSVFVKWRALRMPSETLITVSDTWAEALRKLHTTLLSKTGSRETR